MGLFHDAEATLYGDKILSFIRKSNDDFKQIFSPSVVRIGDWSWPRPDYVCYDEQLDASYALEFKPPFQSKREYLTGLGQALSYLQKHTYSGLIVPFQADDGFHIAEFIADTLQTPEFSQVATSLYGYHHEDNSIELLRPITHQRTLVGLQHKQDETKTFWCWWRDMSHYELYDLLNLSFIYSDYSGDIYSDHIYPKFYEMMVGKHTKQWDGTPRSKKGSSASLRSEKQNYKIPLVQLGLWSRSEGRLTDLGFELLALGKKYGPNNTKFLDRLSYLILVNGKHLDLINMVDKFQKDSEVPASSKEHTRLLEKCLTENGCIGKRKPSAVTSGSKNSYMRDEMKLWNKLKLLQSNKTKNYFFPNKGYKFDWERITNVLKSGSGNM